MKTGTTSLYKAFSNFNYRAGHFLRWVSEPKEGWIEYIKKLNYDAYTDRPMTWIYKDLDKNFPGSKFILTVRDTKSYAKNLENWFNKSPWEIKNPKELEEWLKI